MLGSKIKPFLTSTVSGLVATTLLLGTVVLFPKTSLSQELPAPLVLSRGNSIEANSAQKETIYLNNNRVYSYNLKTAQTTFINGIDIPAGAPIVGRYEPAKGGLRYVANAVIFDDRTYTIDAASEILKDVKDPRDTSASAVAEDAGIGAAGGLILGDLFGHANAKEIIGGAAAGGIVGNVTADRVVVIKPDVPINLYSE